MITNSLMTHEADDVLGGNQNKIRPILNDPSQQIDCLLHFIQSKLEPWALFYNISHFILFLVYDLLINQYQVDISHCF